jgi:hypothetical protein
MNITIYGSYYPPSDEQLLLDIKQILIDDEYENTSLVREYQRNESEDSLEISKKCLLFSDLNYLIFTKTGKRLGLVRELAFAADDPSMISRAQNCVVFDQIVAAKSSIPDLSAIDVKNSGIELRTFDDVKELKTAILSLALQKLRRFSPIISKRR